MSIERGSEAHIRALEAEVAKWKARAEGEDDAPTPVVQGEPVATLHDDGYWTPKKTDAGRELNYILSHAGARIDVYTAPLAAPAPVLTPAQAHADELVAALSDIAHGLEHARIWGGMKWEYNPLHPIHYVPLRDKARAVLAKIEAMGEP